MITRKFRAPLHSSYSFNEEKLIFRITQKLGKKIGMQPLQSMPLSSNPYADWSAHLFTVERVQYIILTNTASLYSILTYGKGITNESKFIQDAISSMRLFFGLDGNDSVFERWIVPETSKISFSKSLNRSVTGSMNDLIFLAKVRMIEGEESPYQASVGLNQAPMSYLDYDRPKNAFKALKIQNTIPFPTQRSTPN